MNVICNYDRSMLATHYFQRWIMFITLIYFLETDPCGGWNMSSTFLYAAILRSQTKPRIQPYQAGNSASSPDQYSAQIHTCFIHNDNARDIHSWTFGKLWFNGQCKTRFSCRLLRAFLRTKLLKIWIRIKCIRLPSQKLYYFCWLKQLHFDAIVTNKFN